MVLFLIMQQTDPGKAWQDRKVTCPKRINLLTVWFSGVGPKVEVSKEAPFIYRPVGEERIDLARLFEC